MIFRLCSLLIGAYAIAAASPAINITQMPTWGTSTPVVGKVTGADLSTVRLFAFIFVPDNGWYSKPSCGLQATYISQDGSFSTLLTNSPLDNTATRFAFYLMPSTYTPQCVLGPGELPASLDYAALTKLIVPRPNDNPYTISFSGLTWTVKSAPSPVSPGPNLFSAQPPAVSIDSAGKLHLRVSPCYPAWCAAEIASLDAVGYGTYRLYVESPLTSLDPNVVLGFFTWSDDGAYANREMDFEFSRWGNSQNPYNAQFVVQPYVNAGNILRFNMPPVASSVHTLVWGPGSAQFQSAASLLAGAAPFATFTAPSAAVPPPGDAHLHINLYLAGGAPALDGQAHEMVISRVDYVPSGPSLALTSLTATLPQVATTAAGKIDVSAANGCAISLSSSAPWLTITSQPDSAGGFSYTTTDNTATQRQATITVTSTNCNVAVGGQRLVVTQLGPIPCQYTLAAYSTRLGSAGGSVQVQVVPGGTSCPLPFSSAADWITATPFPALNTVQLTVAPNTAPGLRTGVVTIAGMSYTVTQEGLMSAVGLRFVPVTPCRIADTRAGQGFSGSFGPPSIPATGKRDFPVPASACGIPTTAQAYSLNATVVPAGPLGYLTLWPTGQPQPFVSTLNAYNGAIVANAAIVPAGANGSISAYASNATDLVLDINGYFVPSSGPETLAFYPVTPCRLVDTRAGFGMPAPFGPPSFTAAAPARDFPILASQCQVPVSARAYSLNFTVVPRGSLGFLSTWPEGQSRPLVSTLNSFDGRVLANAAIVPAGAGGSISVFTSLGVNDSTDVIVDINGYFAPTAGGNPLLLYPVAPCRVVDTRPGQGLSGAFGPPYLLNAMARTYSLTYGPCSLPSSAQAYSLNATVVPSGPLPFLTLWPSNQAQPNVSTLNSFDGRVVANAAIVPAGYGAVNAFASGTTDLVLDVNGYFAP